MQRYVNIQSLSERVGIPVRTLRTMKQQRKIPFIKPGHRTLLFDVDEVTKALQRFRVEAVA